MNKVPIVDEWRPAPEDIRFTNNKDIIIAPVAKFLKIGNNNPDVIDTGQQIDIFWIRRKKSYNSDLLRSHTCQYINYFEKYYDPELEYFTNLSYIKFMVDYMGDYNIHNFIYWLKTAIFTT